MIDEGTTEAFELFEMWARRRKYRLDPEHQLAEQAYQEQKKYRRQLEYLKRKNLIRTKRIEGRLFVELSEKGKIELLERTVRDRPKLSNGYVCLVIFDVPMNAKSGRDAFRGFLKRIGFRQVQKSVWASDHDVFSDVQRFVTSAGIQKWVGMYLAKAR